ncbi:MAG: glycosyltransferase [Planctomycetota bacterium]|nr:glycosyltransferase [Planctomycetota bacterium]
MTTLVTESPTRHAIFTTPSSGRLRVCHMALTLCTGGLERLLVDFARFHDADRFEPEFLALGDVGQPADEIEALGRRVHRIDATTLGKVSLIRRLSSFLSDGKFDVLHTHNAFPHLYGSIAARLAGVSTVIHTRHGRRFGGTWKERIHFSIGGLFSDCVVGVSDDTAELCRSRGWFPSRKVARVWNGVDLDRFNIRRTNHSDPTVITVARLSAEKDLETMLQAAKIVAERQPMFRLIIVGDGPERANLQASAQRLGLEETVRFLGERNDIAQQLSRAAFFVSSSRTEGVSLTLLEAMATELPVIATRVGGNPEVVVDGETGRLVPPRDPQALAAAILKLIDNPQEWDRLGQAGRRRVQQHFCIRSMVQQYEELYLQHQQ